MKLNEVLITEGYTLKKISLSKWDDSAFYDELEDSEDNEPGGKYGWAEVDKAKKGSRKVYSIIDTKTNKEVGKAELESNNRDGDRTLKGVFLGKKFSINVDERNSDPQKLFNKFIKWPSTKKRWGNILKS